jgi:bifunctional N-acetylglucosamine-1-phosphate-uridyltransferase/glucosamine-1-phosphate-acetyltransferase GlmU-like protein
MTGTIQGLFAVVPAAGRGTRLGSPLPKLLTPIGSGATIWTLLSGKLLRIVEHINVIVSPDGESLVRSAVERSGLSGRVSLSIQPEPIGMGDAVFRGSPVWSRARLILVVWGDQAFVSANTLNMACTLHGGRPRTIVLPVVPLPEPYAEYVFAEDGNLISVRQSREGDRCAADGYADVGVFVLSVADLHAAWMKFSGASTRGALTGELNFLPFLPFLSSLGWDVKRLIVSDPREACGINTPEDLEYLRSAIAQDQTTE